jgi:hypothetical protein
MRNLGTKVQFITLNVISVEVGELVHSIKNNILAKCHPVSYSSFGVGVQKS